jgi:predicted MFS family arabinose efflux permease
MTQTAYEIPHNLHSEEESLRYPGWSVAGAAFLGVMVSFAGIVPSTFSIFLNPLHQAFGWKREALGGAFALTAMTVALVSPLIGLLLDRFAPRRIILPAICIFAAALASLSTLGSQISRYYLTYILIGLAANGTAQFAYTRAVLTWFKCRGLALAIVLTGAGAGSFFFPPFTQWAIETHGWRNTYLILGTIALLGLPLTALLIRNKPAAFRSETHSLLPESGSTIPQALRSPIFWLLAVIVMLGAFTENGILTNLTAILTDHGVTAHIAAFAISVRGAAGIVGRLGVGVLLDRFSPRRIQTVILLLAVAGVALLAFATSTIPAFAGSALLGIGLGSEADVAPYLLAKYFRRHFSTLYGLTWTAYAIGGATGPLTLGHLYDRFGSYQPRLILLVGFATLECPIFCAVG